PGLGPEDAVMLDGRDELPHPLVELAHQEAVEARAVLEQPHEGGARHHREPRVADRHDIVLARLVLDDRTLAEPAAGAYPREGHRLAGLRNGADLYQSRDHACPMVECIAPVAHIGALGELPLDHAASG